MRAYWRRLLAALVMLAVLLGTGGVLAGCGADDDAATARPTAYRTPSGDYCTPWLNNPSEADGSGARPCDMPAPTSPPVRQAGMSDLDWALLGGMFGYVMGHHSFYFDRDNDYYGRYIGPAWARNPGYGGYDYGGRHYSINRITNVNVYTSTVAQPANTKYANFEKQYEKDPKFNGYKTANGRTYTADKLPTKKFNGTNVPKQNTGPLGDAPKAKTPATQPSVSKNTPSGPAINVRPPSSGGTYKPKSYTNRSHSSSSRSRK